MEVKSQFDLINPRLKNLLESDTLSINEISKQLQQQGKTIYRFGLGQSPFPVPELLVEALRLHAPEKDYLPVQGLLSLREAVADFHTRRDGIDALPSNIIIGPGSKELVFLLQLVFNGKIIIVSPCWVSYIPQALILGKKLRIIHSSYADRWQLTPLLLEKFTRDRDANSDPALLILNYPGNPDGVTLDDDDLREIAQIARNKNIYILSDEIYGHTHHKGNHVSIARYYPEGTIVSSGLSKWCGAGGWRLGTFTFPSELQALLKKMAVVASETYTSVNAPVQYAAIKAFRPSLEIEEYLCYTRKILAGLGNHCHRLLTEANIRVHAPEGGFYLFIDFENYRDHLIQKGIHSSSDLCSRLLQETGVAILPGSSFNRPPEEFTARLAYVDFDGAKALAAAKTIPLHESLPGDFNTNNCLKTIEGIQHLVQWIKSECNSGAKTI